MKKTDIAMIILIASVSIIVAYSVANLIPVLKVSDEPVKVKTIDEYDSTVVEPDTAVFNEDAINPTVDVSIGGGSSSDSQ